MSTVPPNGRRHVKCACTSPPRLAAVTEPLVCSWLGLVSLGLVGVTCNLFGFSRTLFVPCAVATGACARAHVGWVVCRLFVGSNVYMCILCSLNPLTVPLGPVGGRRSGRPRALRAFHCSLRNLSQARERRAMHACRDPAPRKSTSPRQGGWSGSPDRVNL